MLEDDFVLSYNQDQSSNGHDEHPDFFVLLVTLAGLGKQTKGSGTKHDVSACESCVWRPKRSQDIKHLFIRITVHNVQ